MTIYANVYGGQITVDLNGTGTPAGAVSLQPGTLDFGQVQVNTNSAPQNISVSNSTGSAIPIVSVTVTPPFSIPSNLNNCGTTSLAPNNSCTIAVELTPATPGPVSGTLTLNDGAGTQTAILSGTGEAAPTDVLNPASLTFPLTAAGSVSSAQTLSLTNIGGEPLALNSITASAGFVTSNTCGNQLAGGSICTISVVFAPTLPGNITGTLTVTDALRTQTVSLSGTAVASPTISVNPTSLTFAAQAPGSAPASQTIGITNTGQFSMANIGFQITGAGAPAYSIGTTNCPALLNAGAGCTVQVVFAPTVLGSLAAALAVSSSTSGVKAVSVPLGGVGQVAGGLGAGPSPINFSTVAEGLVSTAQTVTITNSTGYVIQSIAVAVGAPFAVTQNGCTGALGAGSTCAVSVQFQPTAVGAFSGSLAISSPGVANPALVSLSGTGDAGLGINPSQIAFSGVIVGLSSPAQAVTLTNSSGYPVTSLGLAAAAPFAITQNGCPATLAAGDSCSVSVQFQPTSTAAAVGSLAISSAAPAISFHVQLSGTGLALAVDSSSIAFSTIAAGSSTTKTLTVTNPSSYPVLSLNLALAASSSAEFSLPQGSNSCSGTLAAGSNCSATIKFQPVSGGAATGSLTIASAAVVVPPSVSLTGTGFSFTLAPSGLTNQTVVSGQSASYTLVVTPSGAQSTFSIACGTLPTHALCTFNPNGETVSDGVQGDVTVQVSTGQSLAKADVPSAGWRALPFVCALLLVPFALRRRRGIFLLALAAILLATSISSCTSSGSLSGGSGGGGGSGGQSGSSATPTGSYTIPVTVTDNATGLTRTCDANSATCKLTLLVD